MSDICFTINNYSPHAVSKLRKLAQRATCEYLVFAREVGEKGTPHIQGFVQFRHKVTFTAFNKMLNMKKGGEYAACSNRRGTPAQAAGYCLKGSSEYDKDSRQRFDPLPDGDLITTDCNGYDDFLTEPGPDAKAEQHGTLVERPGQGARTDLAEIIARIKSGETSADALALEDPALYARYGRTFEKAEDVALRGRFRSWQTTCTWYHGPTGAGKSHKAFENFDPATHYIWNLSEQFQDGYTGQETVIINEFRGSDMKYSRLLDLIDKWPTMVKRKGRGPAPFLAKHVIVTSCYSPQEAYAHLHARDSVDQLLRRVEVVELEKRAEKCETPEEESSESHKGGLGNNTPNHNLKAMTGNI